MKILTRLSKEVGYAQSVEYFLTQDSRILSGLSRRIGLILAMKHERTLKHVEFVRLDGELILAVLMIEKGEVENRIIRLPEGVIHAHTIDKSDKSKKISQCPYSELYTPVKLK
ncbi:hypothetical protein H704_01213 [Bartonella bacilliformis Peru38]|nr:hypothetical protein X472_00989 [Bartonella bacilliformis San Pedro600-02]EYS95605.1 hypothetical protein X470_00194 [Bartonella bacilliformis Peru-18]KEG16068.1 hypothetical protein H709_01186 [Bartonella bacilliformis CUSCO5]KEG19499.1 hypothetical protein H704_01213 [Bartonella bacilliformis Peru38]KEG21690.1 hypothetical protein H703_01206 [Bartonella bacilliformis Ver075]